MEKITLYRPVGKKEMDLIIESNYKAFPPRLDWQPIFYPVMNEDYAIEIAKEWNANDAFSGYAGFVTAFDVDAEYLAQFEIQNVGTAKHNELWIPADELANFNAHIIGNIRVTVSFFGENKNI